MSNPEYAEANRLLQKVVQEVHRRSSGKPHSPEQWAIPLQELGTLLSMEEWEIIVQTGLLTKQTLEQLCNGLEVTFE